MFKELAATLIHLTVVCVTIIDPNTKLTPDFVFENLERFEAYENQTFEHYNKSLMQVIKGSQKTLKVLQCDWDDFRPVSDYRNLEFIETSSEIIKVKFLKINCNNFYLGDLCEIR
jgi:hypothetical protein